MAASTIKNPIFQNEDTARAYLEGQRWPDGVICPFCGQIGAAKALPATGATGPGWWHCGDCRKKFTVRVGTLYERSHVPLHKWLYATHLLCSSKKGISAHQLHRMLGVTYKTSWFVSHRIREGMKPSGPDAGPLGGHGKIVEADETYIGKADGKRKPPKGGGFAHKMKIVSLVERGGNIRSKRVKDGTKLEMKDILRTNVHPDSILHTDGSGLYTDTRLVRIHESVDHNKEYVRDGKAGRKVHTNTLEGFFSVFKRGMVGTYQHCGEQHLDRYLAEFDFRQNNREKLGIDDAARAAKAVAGITGKRLTYRRIGQAKDA
jgi:transposase-like protein